MNFRQTLLKALIIFAILRVRSIALTSATFSSSEVLSGNSVSVSADFASTDPSDPPEEFDPTMYVVLNEILPNPEGVDAQDGLNGEWVEIYNKSNQSINVLNWYVKDYANNVITINASSTNMGRTDIGAVGTGLEWLVVFMNGQILNNTGDTVTLYSNTNDVVDSYSFGVSNNDTDSLSSNTPDTANEPATENPANEGKSFARIPDGTGEWVDPIPTPESENKVEDTPTDEQVLRIEDQTGGEQILQIEENFEVPDVPLEPIAEGETSQYIENVPLPVEDLGETSKEDNDILQTEVVPESGNKVEDTPTDEQISQMEENSEENPLFNTESVSNLEEDVPGKLPENEIN